MDGKSQEHGHAPSVHTDCYRRQTKGRLKASTSGHVPQKKQVPRPAFSCVFLPSCLMLVFLPGWRVALSSCLCLGFPGLCALLLLLLLRTPSCFITALLPWLCSLLFYKCGEQTREQGIKLASNPAADTKNQGCVKAFMRFCACTCCGLYT